MDASKENYLDYKSALPVINHFENCINVELMSLKTEISRDKIIVLEEKKFFLELYPNLTKLIRLSKTIPVGTASIERRASE